MPSSYSSRLRFELQQTGENRSTWGIKANTDFSLIEAAIAAAVTINLADANHTLTTANGATDEARNAILIITGALTAKRTITIPSVSKIYIISNQTTGGFGLDIKTTAVLTNTLTVSPSSTNVIWSDGTSVFFAESSSGSVTPIALGGTGASTAPGARANLGLGSIATANILTGTAVPSNASGVDGDIYFRTA